MFVKCKNCDKKIERDSAFKVIVNNKNQYYCNENEYLEKNKEKDFKDKVYEIANDIFGYIVINTTLMKEIKSIAKTSSYYNIYNYILENKQMLDKVMNKDFNNEYGKIKYFSTIIKNNLKDYKQYTNYKNDTNSKLNIEVVKTRYIQAKKKKCLEEYWEEYNG